jgi:hypothetical protein
MVWASIEADGSETLHAVTHGGGWGDPFGYHYYSRDGGYSWGGTGQKAYENRVAIVSDRDRAAVITGHSGQGVAGGSQQQGRQQQQQRRQQQQVGAEHDNELILSRRERPHAVLGRAGSLVALTTAVTEAWPCTTSQGIVPDRPPCTGPPVPGVNPDCGPGSNGTIIWCPVDYCYTLWQPLHTSHSTVAKAGAGAGG